MRYLQLSPKVDPPSLEKDKPFRAIVIIEKSSTSSWQEKISDWLVNAGCLYMMAWGIESSSWDDSVDESNMNEWNYKEIPDNHFVMTTWHEKETLNEVFWFARYNAYHPVIEISDTLIVHISDSSIEDEFLEMYQTA